jgi:hypothetical protein
MIDELAVDLPGFGGRATHTRCFLHTVNLVAKAVIREFDIKKKWSGASSNEDEEVMLTAEESRMKQQLAQLSKDLEVEDYTTITESGDNDLRDNTDGLVDENELLTANERRDLEITIRPVQLALVKVSESRWM